MGHLLWPHWLVRRKKKQCVFFFITGCFRNCKSCVNYPFWYFWAYVVTRKNRTEAVVCAVADLASLGTSFWWTDSQETIEKVNRKVKTLNLSPRKRKDCYIWWLKKSRKPRLSWKKSVKMYFYDEVEKTQTHLTKIM